MTRYYNQPVNLIPGLDPRADVPVPPGNVASWCRRNPPAPPPNRAEAAKSV
jgi:hypothetical protein